MYAVGIDVSKGRSTVAVLEPLGKIVAKPFEVRHTKSGMNNLVNYLNTLDGECRIVLEHTGRYYEPMVRWLSGAGLFVSAVNPKLIKNFDNHSLRRVKTDNADAKKIGRFALDKWYMLRQYTAMDNIRTQLKTMNRQMSFYQKQQTAYKNNLIALMDETYPGANKFFTSPKRPDGSEKWVDFIEKFWHVDCVCNISLKSFTEKYQKWCKKHGYIFQPDKPAEIYNASKELIPILAKDDMTKMFVQQAVTQLNAISKAVEELRQQMDSLASQLPEYPVVMSMFGVGTTLGPQLIAEIGDVHKFTKRSQVTAFAGVDPGVNESGDYVQKSVHTTKHGSPYLRRTLFLIMDVLIKLQPEDDPVYRFMAKKRDEGKPYYVYMTAGANKFLRIYFGKVKEYLSNLHLEE
jgi:transposase